MINSLVLEKKHSCEDAVNSLMDNWYEHIKNNKIVITAFLDFKRAFETIDRNILIKKLQRINFSPNIIKWFTCFLNERKQRTKIGNVYSNDIHVNIGVPQGSKLSNLLFILYINDTTKIDEAAQFVMYADDTSVSVVADDINGAIEKMNDLLSKVDDWLSFNKISINVNKCKCIIINYKGKSNEMIKIHDVELEIVKEIKYLGVKLDSRLNLIFMRMSLS